VETVKRLGVMMGCGVQLSSTISSSSPMLAPASGGVHSSRLRVSRDSCGLGLFCDDLMGEDDSCASDTISVSAGSSEGAGVEGFSQTAFHGWVYRSHVVILGLQWPTESSAHGIVASMMCVKLVVAVLTAITVQM
jgi:hypothetical protein